MGLAALAVYRATLLPGVGAWDTAEAQVVLPLAGTMHPTGFPAYVVLGWLASLVLRPLGEPAFVVNLLSALLAAAAASGTVLVVRRLRVPLPIAATTGAGFALTPIVWHISAAADAHAFDLALVVALVLALLRWDALVADARNRPEDAVPGRRADRAIVVAAAVYGVAVANHALALLLAPAIGLFVLAVDRQVLRRPRLVAAAVGTALGVAALLYLELPIRGGLMPAPLVYGHPGTVGGFLEVIVARQFAGDVGGALTGPLDMLGALVTRVVGQFGPLALLVPAGFLAAVIRHPRYALLSGVATLVTVLFASSYDNAVIERYYLGPAFFAWTWVAILAGVVAERFIPAGRGADGTGERDPGSTRPGRRIASTSTAVAGLIALALLVPTGLDLDARWHTADRSRETWEAAFVDDAFSVMAPDAVVLSWWSYSTPLWYGQLVQGRRPDVWIVDDRVLVDDNLGRVTDVIDANLGKRPVYVIRATESDLQSLAIRYAIEPVGRQGVLYRVTGRVETTP